MNNNQNPSAKTGSRPVDADSRAPVDADPRASVNTDFRTPAASKNPESRDTADAGPEDSVLSTPPNSNYSTDLSKSQEVIYRGKPEKAPRKKYSTPQKVAIAAAAVVLAAGLIGGGVYLGLNLSGSGSSSKNQSSTTVQSGQTLTLTDGKNKIESGGTYTFTGSTSDGKITVNTDQDVKIILDHVSITNPSGAAIKCKGTGLVTIELVGENTLTSTDAGSTEDDDGPAAAISSDASLTLTGEGSAEITSNGKGIKADATLTFSSGAYNIKAADDAIHSNGTVIIDDGAFLIEAGDDGIHADSVLTINGGAITIDESYEGLEAEVITINNGAISLYASDDGINAASGSTDSAVMGHPGSAASSNAKLIINDGSLMVSAAGDGLDSNGDIEINGGYIMVDGPTSDGDGALDYDGTMTITGGTLLATGASGMAMNASFATQPSVLVNLGGTYSGEVGLAPTGTTDFVASFSPNKSYGSVVISSPDLKIGETYDLLIDGQVIQTITISQNITGQGSGMMGGGGMGGDPGGGGMGGRRF